MAEGEREEQVPGTVDLDDPVYLEKVREEEKLIEGAIAGATSLEGLAEALRSTPASDVGDTVAGMIAHLDNLVLDNAKDEFTSPVTKQKVIYETVDPQKVIKNLLGYKYPLFKGESYDLLNPDLNKLLRKKLKTLIKKRVAILVERKKHAN